MPYPLKRLSGATRRGQTMAPERQKPLQWLCLTKLPREMCSQLIASKALSRGIIWKSAPTLADITVRKSQVKRDPFLHTELSNGKAHTDAWYQKASIATCVIVSL